MAETEAGQKRWHLSVSLVHLRTIAKDERDHQPVVFQEVGYCEWTHGESRCAAALQISVRWSLLQSDQAIAQLVSLAEVKILLFELSEVK